MGELFFIWKLNRTTMHEFGHGIVILVMEEKNAESQIIKIGRLPDRVAERVFEKVEEGIMVTDHNGHILHVNPAFEIVTGYGKEEVIGKTPKLLQSGKHGQEFYDDMWLSLIHI